MLKKQTRALVLLVSVALATLLAVGGAAAKQNAAVAGPALQVKLSASLSGDTAIYSITLANDGSTDLLDVFVSGSVPPGASFARVLGTPAGAWFRGAEGAGTALQSAAWLVGRIPANGTLGPFMYAVNRAGASDLAAHGWVHWRLPSDGTAISDHVDPTAFPPLGMSLGGDYHETHVKKLALGCTQCHTTTTPAGPMAGAADYRDPLAQEFNLADRRACLQCHLGSQGFYGDDWQKYAGSR